MVETEKSCLVVVDVQAKLAGLMHQKQRLFDNIEILIKATQALGIPILWCQQNPKALGETIPQLAELLTDCEPIDKFSFSCCGDGRFNERLKALARSQVILCGIEAHVCICQTAIDLLEGEYKVHVIADAISSRTPENAAIAISRMAAEGATISSTEMVLFELLKTAACKEFKTIARLIK